MCWLVQRDDKFTAPDFYPLPSVITYHGPKSYLFMIIGRVCNLADGGTGNGLHSQMGMQIRGSIQNFPD